MTPKLDATFIHPGIFVGSRPPTGDRLRQCAMDRVVLCAAEFQPPEDDFYGVFVMRCPFHDDYHKRLDPRMLSKIVSTAWGVAMASLRENVLVTCLQGRNRSALVAVLAMQARGVDPAVSVQILRTERPIGCLENPVFEEIALSGLMKKKRRSARVA